MSYNASADLFYGAILPEDTDSEVVYHLAKKHGLYHVCSGNGILGNTTQALASEHFTVSEYESEKRIGLMLKVDINRVIKLREALTELGIVKPDLDWFLTASYG